MAVCPHETPGGRDRCALCRAEDRLITDPHADYRAEWRPPPDETTPMPDYVRDTWHRITHKQQGQGLMSSSPARCA